MHSEEGSTASCFDGLENAYGNSPDNWGDRKVFQGSYINFGYWDGIDLRKPISVEDRVKSSGNLYRYVLDLLDISPDDTILEVGCGRGVGIIDAVKNYNFKSIVGIDAVQPQVERARRAISDNNIGKLKGKASIDVVQAFADATKREAKSVDKVYSVEVAQHFKNIIAFAREMRRIIRPGGKIVLTSHLSTSKGNLEKRSDWDKMSPPEGQIDVLVPISDILFAFKIFGFRVKYHSIGKHVFPGFEKWINANCPDNIIGLNLCNAYKKGYIDYYVVEAKKTVNETVIDDYDVISDVFSKLPCSVYLKDRKGVYLFANIQSAVAARVGSVDELIGKTDYDIFTKKQADKFRENDLKVIEFRKEYAIEEDSYLPDGSKLTQLSTKKPLIDRNGVTIGVLGITTDITMRKKNEELKLENERQRIRLQEQEKFRKVVDQVVHDTQTQLYILESTLAKSLSKLSEKEYAVLRESVNKLRSIIDVMLQYSTGKTASYRRSQYILVSDLLSKIVEQQKYRNTSSKIEFSCTFDPDFASSFVYGDVLTLERMLNNVINNAVDAIDENKAGIININLTGNSEMVIIKVQDNGKGMSEEVAERLMMNMPVETTKEHGFGIGMTQIQSALEEFKGYQKIESKECIGTKISLNLPRIKEPSCFTEQITLKKGCTVLVLIKDSNSRLILENHLKKYSDDIDLKIFESAMDAVSFIHSFENQKKLFLLTSYKLQDNELNGPEVIQNGGIGLKNAIIIDDINSEEIQSAVTSFGMKIIPASFIGNASIHLEN